MNVQEISRRLGEDMGRRLHEEILNPTPVEQPSGIRAWLIRAARRIERFHDDRARVWEDIADRLER